MLNALTDKQKVLIYTFLVLLLAVIFALTHNVIFAVLYMYIPAFVTLLLLLVITKDGYSKNGWKQVGLLNWGVKSWLVSLILPVLALTASYLLLWHFDPASFKPWNGFHFINTAVYFLGMALFQTITSALGEEFGWRGYLLPKLLSFGKIKAYLFVGLLWAVWHYPLIFIANNYNVEGDKLLTTALFTIVVILLSFITGELRLRSKSIWPSSIFHASHNTMWQLLVSASATTPLMIYFGGESGIVTIVLYSIIAGMLLIF